MECRAYCTASSYEFKQLLEGLQQQFPHRVTSYKDAIHVSLSDSEIEDVFCFSYGAVVFWGQTERKCQTFLAFLKRYEFQPLSEIESDEFTFIIGKSFRIFEDEITLPDEDVMIRLAISHGLAQSVKLSVFETALQKTFNLTKHIPENLANKGSISLSRKEIRKMMGALFIERSSINLHMDVLDAPEFFWKFPELERYYTTTSKYLDLKTRVDVINERLNVVRELFEMLGSELNHQHSSRLEWIIIILIVMEVGLLLIIDVFKLV